VKNKINNNNYNNSNTSYSIINSHYNFNKLNLQESHFSERLLKALLPFVSAQETAGETQSGFLS
jgi:hypothetical protein